MAASNVWVALFEAFRKRRLVDSIRLRWQFRSGSVILGRYRLVRKLGMGSYGAAYLCRDIRSGRLAVLKASRPARGGKLRAKRIFDIETGILERLHHPGIPKLYERFRNRGRPCFIMEHAKGKSLDELLFHDNRAFSEKQSLEIARKLLDIIAYIHAAGIIHRDISIANVILDGESVRLIDFGLARNLNATNSGETEADDVEDDAPTEKKLRRKPDVTSDFYALGHLLLFLLYSTYSEKSGTAAEEASWEEELTLHPLTKKLLRRLLMTEQPFARARDIAREVDRILSNLRTSGQLL